jgi:hypothetical protein
MGWSGPGRVRKVEADEEGYCRVRTGEARQARQAGGGSVGTGWFGRLGGAW